MSSPATMPYRSSGRAPLLMTISMPAIMASSAARTRTAGSGAELGGDGGYLVDQLCTGVLPGIGVVKTVDVAQEHQQVGPAQPGHNGREGIVVAQNFGLAGLDLRRGDRVVLIDHGDDAQLQQRLEGVAQVLGPGGGVHILPGE